MYQLQVHLKMTPQPFALNFSDPVAASNAFDLCKIPGVTRDFLDDFGCRVFFNTQDILSIMMVDVAQGFRVNGLKEVIHQEAVVKINREQAMKPRIVIPQ